MISSQSQLLLEHMKWADSEVWKKVLSFSDAENDERIKKLLNHIHEAQYAFYLVWNGLPLEIPKIDTFKDLKSIANWGHEYQCKLNDFISSDKINIENKIIEIPWAKFMERRTGKKVVPATFEETVLQITSHTTYHRAQVNTRFRELGGEPASVDFIVWVWLGKPKADWGDYIK